MKSRNRRAIVREVEGHAFIQNLRRGHYELGVETVPVYGRLTQRRPKRCPDLRPVTARRTSCAAQDANY